MKSQTTLLLCALLAFAAAGCGGPVNAVCPIMGGKIDGTTNTEWNGKTIGFCCPPCVDEWNSMTDEERTAALAGESTGGHSHGDHDHGEKAVSEDASPEGAEEPEEAAAESDPAEETTDEPATEGETKAGAAAE